jgi:hypothetical protein
MLGSKIQGHLFQELITEHHSDWTLAANNPYTFVYCSDAS